MNIKTKIHIATTAAVWSGCWLLYSIWCLANDQQPLLLHAAGFLVQMVLFPTFLYLQHYYVWTLTQKSDTMSPSPEE